jgi:exopolyphosphatase/guanosine-5'-triphosphate,3'-diphosphate pyrophosphatase
MHPDATDTVTRIGAIDVGTNSVHLVIADVSADGEITVVEKQRSQIALGEGGLDGSRLTPAAMQRCLAALQEFKHACDSFEVTDIHCAATSAVREAQNGVEFCRRIKAEIGIHVRIITGLDEARLIYLGARPHLDFSHGRILLVDLGGGSTEFVVCDSDTCHVRASLPLGHLRATALHRRTDPMSQAEVEAIQAWTRDALTDLAARVHPDDVPRIVGTSGTMRCLARMATLARGGVPTEHDDGLILTAAELDELLVKFVKTPEAKLGRLPGMDDKRRATLPAGAVVVAEVLRLFGKDSLQTSAYSLRDGLVVDWIQRHQPELQRARTEADPRRRSVMAVMERYGVDEPHARQVARFALTLFDATAGLHRLRVDDRRMLEFASLLHDVGHHIAGEDHHRHGEYLIRHTRMSGFSAPEIDTLALLVRHHRGKKPKRADIARLTPKRQRTAIILAGLLAVADGFDRGHDRNVQQLTANLDGDVLHVHAVTREPAHLERWAVIQRAAALRSALGLDLQVEIQQGPALATAP